MKKIIQGRKYDTDTANEICEYQNGYNRTDFHWYRETLYRKKNGEFFLHGEGGPASPYSEVGYGYASGSEKLVPLTDSEARKFVEEHGTVETYEELFGEVEE